MDDRLDLKEENNSGHLDLYEKLQSGEKVKCLQCNNGYYVTDAKDIRKSYYFYCDKCGEFIHFEPGVIIE